MTVAIKAVLFYRIYYSLLAPFYPGEFDLVRTELMQWVRSSGRVHPPLVASRFLWLCRINKVPVMLKEVSRDFGISTGKLMQIMSGTEYVPALGSEDYIERLARQLCLSDTIKDNAKDLIGESLGGSSPTVRACCAVLKAAIACGLNIRKSKIASALDVSTVAMNIVLKNRPSNTKVVRTSLE